MFKSDAKKAGGVRLLDLGLVVALAALAASPALALPAQLDRSLNRVSDHGAFHVLLSTTADPIRMRRIHQWTVHITDAGGKPVSGASVSVDGGMPEHHHGLPTAPRAGPTSPSGDTVIDGMKFSMGGWWVLKVGVQSRDGLADTVTFNIVL